MKKLYHLLMFVMLSTLLVACAASESGGKKEDKKTEEAGKSLKRKLKKKINLKIKPIMMSLLIKLRKKQIVKKSNLPKIEDRIHLKVMLRLIKILIPLL